MKLHHFLLILILFFSCQEENNKDLKKNAVTFQSISNFTIETARDTFYLEEYVRSLATLKNPFFKNSDSKIIVVLESDEDQPLKKDLSNEYNIPVEGFHNLAFDTINQKWFENYNFNKSSVFGKKFQRPGLNKIRGYILEYISTEPPIDSIYDKNKVRKYYFEKNV